MKIVLIEPAAKVANVYSKLSMPLLGPVYLGTILRGRGHEVEILNENICRTDYAAVKADVIGISILTSTAKRGYEIARKFSREKVIMGGVHASLLPEEALRYARQVVIGEGEQVIADIVEGRITDPLVRGKPVENLDSLPFPDFSLIKGYNQARGIVPVSTSRGCPFDCSFCSVTKLFGRKYRFRTSENVLGELRARSTDSFFFCDDNFAAHPARTRALLDLFIKNGIRRWTCQVRCDVARDEKLLNQMARAGCSVACIGFESINQKSLKAFDKKQTLEDIVGAIRAFHRKKIKIHGMFVLGGDDDNTKTIRDTVRFCIKEKIDTIQMMILTPFPGTRVYEDLEKQKRIFTKDWSLYDGQHIVFDPKLLSAKDLQLNVVKAYSQFYSLWRSFVTLLKLRFRNAMFRFMGYAIVREWKKHNQAMHWLLENIKMRQPALPGRFGT